MTSHGLRINLIKINDMKLLHRCNYTVGYSLCQQFCHDLWLTVNIKFGDMSVRLPFMPRRHRLIVDS